jgi:hypothetical protein
VVKATFAMLAACLALLGVAACDDDDDEQSQTAANEALCAEVADAREAASAVTSLDPANMTLSELESATTNLTDSLEDLSSAASDASSADREALSNAIDGLESALQGFGEGESVSQDLSAVATALAPVEQAVDDLGADCPSS